MCFILITNVQSQAKVKRSIKLSVEKLTFAIKVSKHVGLIPEKQSQELFPAEELIWTHVLV